MHPAFLTVSIAQFIEPVLRESYGQPPSSKHLVVVAHGIFNYEFLGALLSRRPEGIDHHWAYKGEHVAREHC